MSPKSWVLPAAAVLLLLCAAALLGLLAARQVGGVPAADGRLAALTPWLLAFRYALVAGVLAAWPWLRGHAARRFRWPPQRAQSLTRARLALWFAVFELLAQSARVARLFGG